MALSIKDPEVDRLARRLARLNGESITETVRAALRERLEREERRRGKRLDRARIDEIVAGIAALPVVDDRPPDELIGYDDAGLPAREFQRFCDRIGEQAKARGLTEDRLGEILTSDP